MPCDCNPKFHPNTSGDVPSVHPTAFVDPTAKLVGHVEIGPNVYVGANAVIRADEPDEQGNVVPVVIGANSNIQDGVVIHTHAGQGVKVGRGCCLTHNCLIHGPCTIDDNCFIGFKSIVYMAHLGESVFVNAGVVIQNVELPARTLVPAGAAITREAQVTDLHEVTQDEIEMISKVVKVNRHLVKGYSNI